MRHATREETSHAQAENDPDRDRGEHERTHFEGQIEDIADVSRDQPTEDDQRHRDQRQFDRGPEHHGVGPNRQPAHLPPGAVANAADLRFRGRLHATDHDHLNRCDKKEDGGDAEQHVGAFKDPQDYWREHGEAHYLGNAADGVADRVRARQL